MIKYSTNPPLSLCFGLIGTSGKPISGSDGVVAEVLQCEMNKTFELRETYSEMGLLGVFQAYLKYAIVLFFRLIQAPNNFIRQAMMKLQELACETSRQGLACKVEQLHTRLKWASLIVAEAKRRTMYTIYLLDSVLSAPEGLPTFLGPK